MTQKLNFRFALETRRLLKKHNFYFATKLSLEKI